MLQRTVWELTTLDVLVMWQQLIAVLTVVVVLPKYLQSSMRRGSGEPATMAVQGGLWRLTSEEQITVGPVTWVWVTEVEETRVEQEE